MKQHANTIECPNCGAQIDVNEILYHQLDDELRKKYNQALAREKTQFAERAVVLEQQRSELETARKELQQKISSAVEEGLKAERGRLEKRLREQAAEEQQDRIRSLQDELQQKSGQLKEFNKAKSEIERLRREKDELRDAIEAESEKKLNTLLSEEKQKIRKQEEEKLQLSMSEKNHVIEQLRVQLQEAQRKAEQGSMQLQGEVLELAIEAWLAENFPLDTIEEIKKGARGADCLQIVNTRNRHHCGSIYYESKRTKGFQAGWIEKFKNDIRSRGADIGVLVTESMPRGMDRMGLRDGIWICTFEEFKGLCVVLRESVIRLSRAIATQENKGDKMGMLYDFLTSNEFRLQIEAIVEGFSQMQSDLDAEKRAMQSLWKKREKQLEKVLLNTNHMYSSIKGIAGSAIQSVPLLELPVGDEGDVADPE